MDHSWKPSEMYESYFGFKDTPFRLSADEKFRYAHKNYLRASAYLAYALEQGEGFVMITGQPGSGKTTLIRDVISELDEARYNILNIITSQLQAEELLRKVALEYGFPAENANKATLLTNIQKHLSTLYNEGKRSILFLDEAQNLSHNALEELRLLSNLQQGKHSLLQVILVGHEELRRLVVGPEMKHVQQRLIASCQIDPLSLDQTREYILHRLGHVGWQTDPKIEDEVFQLIHIASQGVPRNINHLMSQLLLFACLEEKHLLTDEDALTVIEELIDQQRINLIGEESFKSFANRYRAERQNQVVRHAAGYQSSTSPRQQQNDTGKNDHDDGENSVKPDNDGAAPDSDSTLVAPDSDWFMWHDETPSDADTLSSKGDTTSVSAQLPMDEQFELKLPNADDIWNGTMESTDLDDFFPDNRRQKPTFSVKPPNSQPTTPQIDGQDFSNHEHSWGGVWFMSSEERRHGTVKSINTISVMKQDNTITVNENLSMPSVWVEDCPDITASDAESPNHQEQRPNKVMALKRSFIHITAFVSLGVVVLLVMRMFPEEFNGLLQSLHGQQEESGTEPQVAVSPVNTSGNQLKDASSKDVSSNDASSNDASSNDASSKDVSSKDVSSKDASSNVFTDHDQTTAKQTVTEPQPLETSDIKETVSVKSDSTESDELSLDTEDSEITSYQNIELATRYAVHFEFNKFTIPSKYESLLKSIRDKMLLDENNFLKITGYADSQGNGNYNYRLSLKRAEEVKEYFTLRGITDDRLQVAAVGSVNRVEPRLETIDIRKQIRRVEVILFPQNRF